MMRRTIFYSWQSQTEQAVNRYLIRDALAAAAKHLTIAYEVDEATRDVAGSPPIFETILRKIEQGAVFVGDITIVTGVGSRPSCNANVLIEYGFALAKLGERRLIPVLNQSYGLLGQLPFDLQHKAVRVIYDLPADSDKEAIKATRSMLEGRLRSELRLVLESPGTVFELSENEVRIAEYILRESWDGEARTYYSMEDLSTAISLDIKGVKRSVAELVSRHYLERQNGVGTDSPPVGATAFLFWDFDLYVHGWAPREDAKAMARALVETSDSGYGHLSTKEFAERQGWSLRQLNPAFRFLVASSIVNSSKIAASDVVMFEIFEIEATRAFIRGEFDPDALRRSRR